MPRHMPIRVRIQAPVLGNNHRAEKQDRGADLSVLLAEMAALAKMLPGLSGDRT